MSQPFSPQQPQLKTRSCVLIFLKGATAPLVLYFENPKAIYQELLECLKSPSTKLIEKEPIGPIKKVSFLSNQIAAVAIQEEQYT